MEKRAGGGWDKGEMRWRGQVKEGKMNKHCMRGGREGGEILVS